MILSRIRQNYGAGASFSTDFTLTIYWDVREKEETKKGSIALGPDDRFRVMVGKELFVSDGETCWHQSADQVVVRQLAETDVSTLPSRIFASYLDSCSLHEQGGETALLSWKADSGHSAGHAYTSVEISAQVKTGRITRCVMVDRNNNRFTYVFGRTEFNKKFPGGTFAFVIPKNARTVDMRK